MVHLFKSTLQFLQKPEWVAAIALLIQAAILGLQWKILRRHAETMERYTDVAGAQAETARLIGQALQQQGKTLDEQTKVMDQQFKFQRRVEAKIEREKVFEAILDLHSRFVALTETLSTPLPPGTTIPDISARDRRDRAWSDLHEAILPCQKALIAAIHLSTDEKNYFMRYCQELDTLKRTDRVAQDMQQVKAIREGYEDFARTLMDAAQTPL